MSALFAMAASDGRSGANAPFGSGPSRPAPAVRRPVLVVDDEGDARSMLALLLELEGYEVLTARDGVEALEILQAEPRPGVVLLDLMMPRLDGWGVVREMQATPHLTDVPVVLLSGVADLEGSAADLGVAAAMVKPVDVDRLLETVRRFCRR